MRGLKKSKEKHSKKKKLKKQRKNFIFLKALSKSIVGNMSGNTVLEGM